MNIPKAAKNPDEIVLQDLKLFHLEKLENNYIWLGVYGKNGKSYHLHINVNDNKLNWYWYDCNDDWLNDSGDKYDQQPN